MKWVRLLSIGIIGLFILVILIFAAIILYDAAYGSQTAEYANTTYTDEAGIELIGYLAQPEGPGPHPAVLLIHEWWGLNEGITILADALAAEGYVVLAPDAYRGQVTAAFPRALWLRLTTPEDQVFNDIDAALAYLMRQEQVDPQRIASMGFCFGGGHSLQLGMRQSENLALTILYYGAVVTEPDLLRPLTDDQPVLGIFGAEDRSIPVADVLEFEAALNSLAIPNQVTIYEGVGHAFLNEDNYQQPGAAMDAWQQTLRFLADNLQADGR